MKKKVLISILSLSVILLFQFCQKDDSTPSSDSVEGFSYTLKEVNVNLVDFINKAQAYETTDVSTMPIDDVKPFMDNYILSAELYLESINKVLAIQENKKKSYFKDIVDGPDCSAIDFVPGNFTGLNPALAKAVGDLIEETKGEVDEIQYKWKSGEIDDNTYTAAMNQLKVEKPIKAVDIGFGAVMGTGAAMVVGLAAMPTALSALATVTVVTATGAVVGATATWVASWYRGDKDGEPSYYMLTGTTEAGNSLPLNLFGENASLMINIDGYAPVSLSNFELPVTGIKKIIEIEGVKIGDAEMDGSTQVCFYKEEMENVSCDEVQLVTAGPSPLDPGPYVGVTVTATLIPIAVGCNISFSIVGTDGYSNSANYSSNEVGQASFYIPGGDEGVVDNVTVTTANGKTYTVTYVF